jgi:hypothetical protein
VPAAAVCFMKLLWIMSGVITADCCCIEPVCCYVCVLLLQGFDVAANTLLWVFAFEVQPLPTRSLATGIVTAWHSLQVGVLAVPASTAAGAQHAVCACMHGSRCLHGRSQQAWSLHGIPCR